MDWYGTHTRAHTHTHVHTHTHTKAQPGPPTHLHRYGAHSDKRQVDLALGQAGKSPSKAERTHERAGALVFAECHTSSGGEAVTGQRRALKQREGCAGSPLWLPLMSAPIL